MWALRAEYGHDYLWSAISKPVYATASCTRTQISMVRSTRMYALTNMATIIHIFGVSNSFRIYSFSFTVEMHGQFDNYMTSTFTLYTLFREVPTSLHLLCVVSKYTKNLLVRELFPLGGNYNRSTTIQFRHNREISHWL